MGETHSLLISHRSALLTTMWSQLVPYACKMLVAQLQVPVLLEHFQQGITAKPPTDDCFCTKLQLRQRSCFAFHWIFALISGVTPHISNACTCYEIEFNNNNNNNLCVHLHDYITIRSNIHILTCHDLPNLSEFGFFARSIVKIDIKF